MRIFQGSAMIFLAAALSAKPQSGEVTSTQETARAYFDGAATTFVKRDPQEALHQVQNGLHVYPGDFYLTELERLLKQQQQQQNQKQEQNEKSKQQSQDQQQQQQNKQDQQKLDQQQQAQKQQADQKQAEEKNPESMTEKEAALLLDSLKEDEQSKRADMRIYLGQPHPVEKDW